MHCPTIPNTIQLKINFNRNAIMHYATLFIDHASYSYTPDYNIFKKINFFLNHHKNWTMQWVSKFLIKLMNKYLEIVCIVLHHWKSFFLVPLNYLIQEFTYNFQQAIVIATLTKLIMSSRVIVTHLEPLTNSGNTN